MYVVNSLNFLGLSPSTKTGAELVLFFYFPLFEIWNFLIFVKHFFPHVLSTFSCRKRAILIWATWDSQEQSFFLSHNLLRASRAAGEEVCSRLTSQFLNAPVFPLWQVTFLRGNLKVRKSGPLSAFFMFYSTPSRSIFRTKFLEAKIEKSAAPNDTCCTYTWTHYSL